MSESDVSRRLAALGVGALPEEIAEVAEELGRLRGRFSTLARGLSIADGANVFDRLMSPPPGAGSVRDRSMGRPSAPAEPAAVPLARVQSALAAARRRGATLNCFVELFASPSIRRARRLALRPGGEALPLYGMPYAYKDIFVGRRRSPTVGIGAGHRWTGRVTSTVLRRLDRAGAIPIGALNLDPHCYTATGFNPHFGRSFNPHDRRFAVGGSSGAAAAAVASAIVPFAIGSDTGGSVRIPAALCGVYGLKPTHDLVRDPGMAPLSRSHDSVGIIARSPQLIARVLEVLAPFARSRDRTIPSAGIPGLRIGYCAGEFGAGLDGEVDEAVTEALGRLAREGAEVVEVPFPSMEELNLCASVVTSHEAAALHMAALVRRPDHYPDAVRRRLLLAACIETSDYRQALRLRGRSLKDVLTRTFAGVDWLICPTLRRRAPRVDDMPETDTTESRRLNVELLRMNRPFSYLGLPALSMPVGVDRNGIPIGLQLIGKPFSDFGLLALAVRLDAIRPMSVTDPVLTVQDGVAL